MGRWCGLAATVRRLRGLCSSTTRAKGGLVVEKESQVDAGWDNAIERVLRNEGRLLGLEQLVRETRESDRKLVEQRSDSLAQELERRAESLARLTERERETIEQKLALLREIYDAAIYENRKQSDEAIKGNEEHSVARYGALVQQVAGWRESDREARDLATVWTNQRLDALNHADEKRQEFQANAVTRELFTADREAQTQRESVLRDQIIALDRTMLGMTPTSVSEKAHSDVAARNEAAVAAASLTLNTKINVLDDKIAEMKTRLDTSTGRSTGYSSLYGWAVAAVGLIITFIIAANTLAGGR